MYDGLNGQMKEITHAGIPAEKHIWNPETISLVPTEEINSDPSPLKWIWLLKQS